MTRKRLIVTVVVLVIAVGAAGMITTLLQLAGLFAVLGLLSVGGGNAILADMQTATVDTYQWMSDREFLDIFAISRAAPGPGTLVVALIGLKAAGFLGAAVAFVAMLGPPFILVHCAARAWHHARNTGWYGMLEQALAPVAIGLSFAGGSAVIGLSLARENRTFQGLPLDDALAAKNTDARCGLIMVDLATGTTAAWVRIEGVVRELFDVAFLPGLRQPNAIGFKSDEIARLISIEG